MVNTQDHLRVTRVFTHSKHICELFHLLGHTTYHLFRICLADDIFHRLKLSIPFLWDYSPIFLK